MILNFDASLDGEEFCVIDPIFLLNSILGASINVAVEGCNAIAPSIQPPPPVQSPPVEDTVPPVIMINGSKLKKNNEVRQPRLSRAAALL